MRHKTEELRDRATKTAWPQEAKLAVLLRACATADLSALQELYIAQAPRLHGLALRITNDSELAADAVHDTFVQVWEHADRFDSERGNAGAWLTGIVRYRALDIKRLRSRERLIPDLPDQEDETPDALARLVGIAEVEALHRCLGLLESNRRQMLMSAYVEGLSHRELAKKTGTPIGTIKSSIRRTLARLKRCLGP